MSEIAEQKKEGNPLVSLIIPVYNTENTLRRCMDSALNQSFSNYEIILVDDGSEDNSPSICDKYANDCHNVRALHKENGGLGSARNAGIDAAKGKYICFADSDDYLNSDYLECLVRTIIDNGSDIVIAGYYLKRGNVKTPNSPRDLVGNYRGKQYYNFLLEYAKGNSYLYFAWNKLFKRSVIQENNIKYIDRHCAEDMQFNAQYYRYIHSASVISNCIYCYTVDNVNSLSNRRRAGFWNDMKIVLESYQQIFEGKRIKDKTQAKINNLALVLLRNTLSNYISNESFNKKDAVKFTKECCEDKALQSRIQNIIPMDKFNRIILNMIKGKRYMTLVDLIRLKAFLKWHAFGIFSRLRSWG